MILSTQRSKRKLTIFFFPHLSPDTHPLIFGQWRLLAIDIKRVKIISEAIPKKSTTNIKLPLSSCLKLTTGTTITYCFQLPLLGISFNKRHRISQLYVGHSYFHIENSMLSMSLCFSKPQNADEAKPFRDN